MGFYDKCLRVHSGNFRWETWKGGKSFRYYIWNWTWWKPFRRDVWVKALRNVNLLSLKLCNTEYEVWFTFLLRILFLRTFYLTDVCFSYTFKTSWLELRVFPSEQLSYACCNILVWLLVVGASFPNSTLIILCSYYWTKLLPQWPVPAGGL